MASKVGEAYVLVHTRTRPLSTAQKRALKRQAGEGARSWTSAFGKEVEARADQALSGLERKLADVFAKDDFDGLRKEFKTTAETADYLRNSLEGLRKQKRLNSREFEVLKNQVDAWEGKMIEADASMQRIAEQDHFGEWLRKQEAAHRRNFTVLTRRLREEIGHHDQMDAVRRRGLANQYQHWDEEFRALERATEARDRMLTEAYRMHEQFVDREEESLARRLGIHRRHLVDFDTLYRRNLTTVYEVFERNEGGANRFTRGMNRMNRQLTLMPNIVGVMFGRGSRNNLLNFLGSAMRNLSRIPAVLVSGFTAVIDRVSSTVEAFTALSRTMGPMRAAFTLARMAVAGVVATLGTLAIAIISASFGVPALAAAISMLAGVFTAWAAVLATGILGMLVPLAPLLFVVAGGFVAVAVAMGRYWSKMQDIKEEGGQLTAEMRRLDESVSWVNDSLDRLVKQIAPAAANTMAILAGAAAGFIDAIGPGARRGLERFNDAIDSPATRRFASIWADSLPGIFEDFVAGLGQMTSGLVAFFAPILPYVERLSSGFDGMMTRFNTWASSVGGQNTIAEWMDRAWRAADTLWSVLGNVWGILSSIFNIGTDAAGQGFLENLERITAEFDEWLKSEEGRESLTNWFEDAAEFASNLWEILGDIGTAFKSLDTDQAREDLNRFLGVVEDIVELSDEVAKFFETVRKGIGDWWGENGETKNFARDVFNVDGNTWAEIASDMWEGFSSAVAGAASSLWAENETTKQWARDVFKVGGETWVEIAGEMWSGLSDAVGGAVSSWWGENETTKQWARETFNVDGATWVDIVGDMWDGFSSAFARGLASWWGENEGTKDFVRDLFKVDGEDWSDIVGDLWSNFISAMVGWNPHRGTENEETKQFVRQMFNVDGATWDDIASEMFTNVLTAIDNAGAKARENNPTTIRFFQRLFRVDGATYTEIASDVWDNFIEAIISTPARLRADLETTKQWVRTQFKVEADTWSGIVAEMWSGLWEAFNSAADQARAGNPKTQEMFRNIFRVEGETWGEILTNMWSGFTTALSDLASFTWGGNPQTQQIFRDVFRVEGETWGEILTNMWTGFTEALGGLAAFAWAGNPKTQEMFRQVFNVEGETWGEILTNMWNGFTEGLGQLVSYAWEPNPHTQEIFRGIFQVDGKTWGEIITNIWTGFTTGMGNFAEHSAAAEAVKFIIRDIFNVDGATWAEIATNLWQGFADGLAAGFTYLVIEPFERFISDVKSLFGIASPSTVFFAMGVDIVLGLWNGLVSMWGGFWGYVSGIFSTLISSVGTWLSNLPTVAATWFSQMWTTATTWASQMVNDVITWIATLPGRFTTWLLQTWTTVSTRFREMYNSAVQWARSLVDDAVAAIAGLPGRVGSALSGLVESIAAPFRNAYNTAKDWIGRITGLGGGGITVSAAGGGSSRFAAGGLVTSPTRALIGEAGPEVVVPLRRPLMQVDPSVRALSAILQGRMATASTGGGVQSTRPQIVFSEGSIVVQTVATDVVGIAESVVDRIAVRAGI